MKKPLFPAGLAVLAALCGPMLAQAPARAASPNIVLILADDMGHSDYSFLGHPQIRTPHIDKLASQGLVYRRGYVPSSLCCPSLAVLITGLYGHQSGITSNDPPLTKPQLGGVPPQGKTGAAANQDETFLAQRQRMIDHIDRVPTLPRLLAEKGYVSFQSGKWWMGNFARGGFTDGMTHGDPKRGARHGDEGLKIGRQGMKPVLEFIDGASAAGKPFFLWYAPMMPHDPHTPPERLLAKYRDKTPSIHLARYWAMCEWFDETCGELLNHLDKKGLAENTIVVYVCDNGWIQDESSPRFAPKSKRSQYDGGLRTPIIIRYPGKVQPRMADERVISIDIAPTILAAAGIEPTKEMQGVNLLDRAAVEKRKAIFGEIFAHNAVDIERPATSLEYRWVIAGDWKLILPGNAAAGSTAGERAKIELYDLSRDPAEETNLAAKEREVVERLTKMLDAWWPAKNADE